MSRRNSDNNLYPSTRPPPPYNGGSQPRQNYGSSFTHPYGVSTTNAGVNFKSGATNSPRRHSEQLGGMGGVGGKRDGDFPRSQSPTSSSGTNSSNMGTAMAKLSPAGKPPVAALNVPSSGRSGRPATGPVRAAHTVQGTRERSQSVDSIEGTESAIEMGGGMRGRMRDVEDDAVLISVTSTSQAGDSSDLVRPPLSSVTRRDGSVPPTSSTGLTASQEPLMRQGSSGSPYNSGDIRSGEGVFGQPHSSQFPTGTSDQNKAKAVTGEGSIDFSQYKRALSKTSSSGSSYEALPGTKRSTSRDENLFELSEQRDQEVTALTERLSVVEGEKEQLRKDKEKLERKLNEAKQVAAQADVAVTEISRLEAELKKGKDDMLKLRRARQISPEAEERSFSLKLSHELDIVRAKLECEVSARAAVEQEMCSLKQSLVVSGQDGRTAIVSKLRERVTELEGTVDGLRQALAGKELTLVDKEVETKRQNQVQARTIADLQSKLSEARQQREELRQSSGSGARTPGVGSTAAVSSPDVAAMAKQLREKEATIQMYSQQLQQFEKTAREVAKITLHSKQQSQKVATLKENLDHTQEALGKKEAELKAIQDELAGMKTHYDNILRTKTAQLAKKDETVKQLREETGDLRSQVAQLVEAEAKRSEAEQALQRAQTQLNHWKQKSIQQDMVIQTKNQELERGRREMDGLKTTVSAQGKEVERLQRENDALRGDMETHRLTAMTYKEDFESERKDREAVHTKIADMETRYRHQLEAMGEQLRRVTEEAERHRETVATKEDELHQQSQLMTAELHQKEAELSSAGQQIQTLKEEVMSKTQQVKQYKKQIDQLTSEAATFKQQAQGHMEQIEFYAKKTEEYGRQKTFREIHERKIVQLEAQCDRLRAENNELRSKMDALKLPASSAGLQSRTPPLIKAHILGGGPVRPVDGGLPSKYHVGGHHGPSSPTHADRSHNAGYPSNYQLHHSNHSSPNHQHHTATPPYSNAGPTVTRQGTMGGQPSNYTPASQFSRQDSPYASLPSSGLGYAPPSAGEMVDKDSPPNSSVGLGVQLPPGQQRRAHSHMLSMATSGNTAERYPAPPPPNALSRPPAQGYQPQGHQQPPPPIYSNLPMYNTRTSGSGGVSVQGRHYGDPERQAHAAMRQPHTQDVASIARRGPQLSTPTEETHHRRFPKPPLEGYVKPQQASSSHPVAGQRLAVQPMVGGASGNQHHSTVSPSTSSGDISKGIDSVIEETVSRVREDEQVAEGDDGEGIPYDSNLVCPKCRMKFREGEIQKFRRHVSSAHK